MKTKNFFTETPKLYILNCGQIVNSASHFPRTGFIEKSLDEMMGRGVPIDMNLDIGLSDEDLSAGVKWQEQGSLISPYAYPPAIDPACWSNNWHTYDAATCQRLLEIVRERWLRLGYAKMDAFATYTPGNGFVEAMRTLGISYLNCTIAPCIDETENWRIAHVGMPINAYTVSDQDFRHPGASRGPAVFASSMCTRSPIEVLNHWPENSLSGTTYIQGPDRALELGESIHENFLLCEDWIRQVQLTGKSKFVIFDFEFFVAPKAWDTQRRWLDWVAKRTEMGQVQAVSMQQVKDWLGEAGGVLPQTLYWRGDSVGRHLGNRPGSNLECLLVENSRGQWSFKKGNAGALRRYDYTENWENLPAHVRDASVPPVHVDQVIATTKRTKVGENEEEIELTLTAAEKQIYKIAVWDALEGLGAPFEVVGGDPATIQIEPHPSKSGGCIVIDHEAGPEPETLRIRVRHSGARKNEFTREWRGLVAAHTGTSDGRELTRIALDVPYRLKFRLQATSPRRLARIRFEYICGGERQTGEMTENGMDVILDGTQGVSVLRLWDVTAAEITISKMDLDLMEDQIRAQHRAWADEFGMAGAEDWAPLSLLTERTQKPAWCVELAKRASDRDIADTNELVGRWSPNRKIAAMHCASRLEYGSCNKEFLHDGYDVPELFDPATPATIRMNYADCGRTNGPGEGGWAQFAYQVLFFEGCQPDCDYQVALNVYDPDCLHTIFQAFATPASEGGEKILGDPFRVQGPFRTAQGRGSRHSRAAFLFLDIPRKVTEQGGFNLRLESDSGHFFWYDKIAENSGNLFVAHIYLLKKVV